jgi:hypothetical protein
VLRSGDVDDAWDLLDWFGGGIALRSRDGGNARGFCYCGLGLVNNAVGFREFDSFGFEIGFPRKARIYGAAC